MKLKEQIEKLSDIGVPLNKCVTITPIIFELKYKIDSFDFILFVYEIENEEEPWRYFCDQAWNFDTEAIEDVSSNYRQS